MNWENRTETFFTTNFQLSITHSILIHFKFYLYQENQHEKIYLNMSTKWRIKVIEFPTFWRTVSWFCGFKLPLAPNLLYEPCDEALYTNWLLNWLGSSWTSNLHVHVHELNLLDSWWNSSNQCLIPTKWHSRNTIMQENSGVVWRIFKFEMRAKMEGREESRSRMCEIEKFCYD